MKLPQLVSKPLGWALSARGVMIAVALGLLATGVLPRYGYAALNAQFHRYYTDPSWPNYGGEFWRVNDHSQATWAPWAQRPVFAAHAIMIESHRPEWPEWEWIPGLCFHFPPEEDTPRWLNGHLTPEFDPPRTRRTGDRIYFSDLQPTPLPSWATDPSFLRDDSIFIENETGERSNMHLWVIGYGWPLPWLRSIHLRDRFHLFNPLPTIDDVGKEHNWQVLEGTWRDDALPLPGRVMFGNLLLNVIMLSALSWLMIATLLPFIHLGKVTLGYLRRRRGRCPRCAYDLRGDLVPGCPECGWGRVPDASGE